MTNTANSSLEDDDIEDFDYPSLDVVEANMEDEVQFPDEEEASPPAVNEVFANKDEKTSLENFTDESMLPMLVTRLGSSSRILYYFLTRIIKKIARMFITLIFWFHLTPCAEENTNIKLPDWNKPFKRNRKSDSKGCPIEGCSTGRSPTELYCSDHVHFYDHHHWVEIKPHEEELLVDLFMKSALDGKLKLFALTFAQDDMLVHISSQIICSDCL
jgi:hypothetical protein